jgi:hypothetical protein
LEGVISDSWRRLSPKVLMAEPPTSDSRALRVAKDLLRRALWFPLAVFLAHVILSRVLFAYAYFPRLDRPVHVLGGIAIAFSVWRGIDILVRARVLEPLQPAVRVVLVFALTCAAAVFWEFAEFVSDRTIGTHAQLGLDDTLLDMSLGILGGLAYLGWKALRERVRQ